MFAFIRSVLRKISALLHLDFFFPIFFNATAMSVFKPNLVLCGAWRKVPYTAIRPIRKECPQVWLGRRFEVHPKCTGDSKAFLLTVSAMTA